MYSKKIYNQIQAGFVMTKIKTLNKDKLYKKWKRLTSETNFIALANIKKEIKKFIRQAKGKEEIRIADLSKENPRSFFSDVNNRKHIRCKIVKESIRLIMTS